jgi:hypothetical protein
LAHPCLQTSQCGPYTRKAKAGPSFRSNSRRGFQHNRHGLHRVRHGVVRLFYSEEPLMVLNFGRLLGGSPSFR